MKRLFLSLNLISMAFASVESNVPGVPYSRMCYRTMVTVAKFLEPNDLRLYALTDKKHLNLIILKMFHDLTRSGFTLNLVEDGKLYRLVMNSASAVNTIPKGVTFSMPCALIVQMLLAKGVNGLFAPPSSTKLGLILEKNPISLLAMYVKNNSAIARHVAEGLAEGKYRFTNDHAELRKLADAGWERAQHLVASGLANGWHGFPQNHDELRNLAVAHISNLNNHYVVAYLKTLPPLEMARFLVETHAELTD